MLVASIHERYMTSIADKSERKSYKKTHKGNRDNSNFIIRVYPLVKLKVHTFLWAGHGVKYAECALHTIRAIRIIYVYTIFGIISSGYVIRACICARSLNRTYKFTRILYTCCIDNINVIYMKKWNVYGKSTFINRASLARNCIVTV